MDSYTQRNEKYTEGSLACTGGHLGMPHDQCLVRIESELRELCLSPLEERGDGNG